MQIWSARLCCVPRFIIYSLILIISRLDYTLLQTKVTTGMLVLSFQSSKGVHQVAFASLLVNLESKSVFALYLFKCCWWRSSGPHSGGTSVLVIVLWWIQSLFWPLVVSSKKRLPEFCSKTVGRWRKVTEKEEEKEEERWCLCSIRNWTRFSSKTMQFTENMYWRYCVTGFILPKWFINTDLRR